LVSQPQQEDVVANRTRLGRGDARRNARLARLRQVVRQDLAVLAVDLADDRQEVVVTDHDSRVLTRYSARCRAWELGGVLRWGASVAAEHGFAGIVVACEPTGHRWRVLGEHAAALGVDLVCVQPMLVSRAREAEDFTRDKSDPKDAVLIARLAVELRCYLPERPEPGWARLRQLGARRAQLLTQAGAARQQLRDLLECAWPAALGTAAKPLDSLTWRAALSVTLRRVADSGDLTSLAAGGPAAFARAVGAELGRWGGQRRSHRILGAVWAATGDPAGVPAQRPGALERAGFALGDWHHALDQLAIVEQHMVAALEEFGLTGLVATIPGLSAVGAAAILAETGDPTRFDHARALVKHAGLCPRDNASGTYQGATRISGRGRPLLRVAAWRAVWGALPHNPVLRARYTHLTTRAANPLTDHQARTALAAALLRQLWVVTTKRVSWDAAIAAGLIDPPKEVTAPAA
jgi:transposase